MKDSCKIIRAAVIATVCIIMAPYARSQTQESAAKIVALPAAKTASGDGLRLIASTVQLHKVAEGVQWSDPAVQAMPLSTTLLFFCSNDASYGLPQSGENLQLPANSMSGPLKICSGSRFFAGEGGTIRVYLVEKVIDERDCEKNASLPELVVAEKERDTLLAIQFRQILPSIKAPANAPTPGVCAWAWPDLTLSNERAFVSIGAASIGPPPRTGSMNVTTGSKEHWFLSADAIIKGASQLKYNPDTKSTIHKEMPDKIYLGINWMLGDVYGKYQTVDHRRIVIKGLIQANKRPFDSAGIGLGYRFADIFSPDTASGKNNSGFVLYVAHYWTKPDSDNLPSDISGRTKSVRVGLSYSLGTAIEWLKK